jgi:plasmid stabilization system protein ParE
MRVEFSRYVESDLEAIADWIAEDNPRRAVTFIGEVREAFRRIGEGPQHYQLRPDIGEDARLAVVGNYVILFRLCRDAVRIERVVFGGRDLPAFFQ